MCGVTADIILGLFLTELVKQSKEGVLRERLDSAIVWAASVTNDEITEHLVEILTNLKLPEKFRERDALSNYVINIRTVLEAFHREVVDDEPSVSRFQAAIKLMFTPEAVLEISKP